MNRLKISSFAGGVNQALDDGATHISQSRSAQNVDVSNGDLRTIKGYSKYVTTNVGATVTRLMKFYKTNTSTGVVTSCLLAATAAAVYYWTGSAWTALGAGVHKQGLGLPQLPDCRDRRCDYGQRI